MSEALPSEALARLLRLCAAPGGITESSALARLRRPRPGSGTPDLSVSPAIASAPTAACVRAALERLRRSSLAGRRADGRWRATQKGLEVLAASDPWPPGTPSRDFGRSVPEPDTAGAPAAVKVPGDGRTGRRGWPFIARLAVTGRPPAWSRVAAAALEIVADSRPAGVPEVLEALEARLRDAGTAPAALLSPDFKLRLQDAARASTARLFAAGLVDADSKGFRITEAGSKIRSEGRARLSRDFLEALAAGRPVVQHPPLPPGRRRRRAPDPPADASAEAPESSPSPRRTPGRPATQRIESSPFRRPGRPATQGTESSAQGTPERPVRQTPPWPGWPFLPGDSSGGIPENPRITAAVLATVNGCRAAWMEQVREVLISLMAQAGTPANAVLAPELMKRLGERITAAFPRLMQAGLVVRLARGSYAITPAGREAASRWPERVDSEFFKAIAGDAPAGRKESPGGPEAAPSGRAASTVAGGQPSVPRPGWPFRRDGAAGRPDRDTIRAALLAVMGRLSMAASSEIRRALDALLAEAEMPPETVGTPEFGAWLNGKISLCMADLRQTGILDRLSRGVYRLTDAGRGLWARMPERISLETLSEISSRAPESRTTEGPAQGGRAPEGPAREGILPDAHGLRPGWPFLGTESGRLPEISRIAAAILALAEPAPGTRAHEFRQTIAGLIAQAGMPPPSALPLRFDTWLSSRIHLSLRRLTKAGILKHEHFGTYSLTPMGERIRAERRELVSDRILSGLAAGTLKLPEVAASRPPVPASASPGISDGDGAVGGEAFGPEAAGCPATGTKATGPKAAGGGGAADGLAADGLAAGNRTAGREEAGGDAAGNRTAGREGTGGEAAGYGTSLFEAADGKSGDGGKPERPGWPFLSWTPGGGLPDQDRIAAAALALAGRRPVAETRPIALAVAELLIAAGMPPAEARSPGFVRMLSAAVRDSLRKFIKRGLMERLTSGLYRLTATGRAVAALAPERADSRVLRAAGRGELPVAPVELPAPPWPGWPFVPGGAKPPTLSRLTSAILYVLGAFGEADTKQTLRALTDMLEQAGMPRGDARPPDFPGWLAKRVSLMFASLKKAGLARNVGHGAFGITDIGRAALAEMPEQLTNSLLSSTAVAFRDGSSGAGKPDPWPGWPFKPGESMAVAIRGAAMTTAALAILELRPGAAEAQIIQGAASRLVLANKGAGRTVRTGLAGQVGLALGPVLERLVRNGLIIRSGEGYRLTIAGKGTLASRRMNPACAKGAGLSPEDPWKAVERALRLAREIELNRLSRHVRLLDGKRLEALAARLAVTLAPPSAGPPRFRVKAGSPVGREDLTALAAVSAAQGAAEAFLFAPFGADAVAAAHDKSAAGGMTVLDASAIAELMYESGTGLETFRNVALRTPDPDFFARLES